MDLIKETLSNLSQKDLDERKKKKKKKSKKSKRKNKLRVYPYIYGWGYHDLLDRSDDSGGDFSGDGGGE